jgi:hypothetical protein
MSVTTFLLVLLIGLLTGGSLAYQALTRPGLTDHGRAARELQAMQDAQHAEHLAHLAAFDGQMFLARGAWPAVEAPDSGTEPPSPCAEPTA